MKRLFLAPVVGAFVLAAGTSASAQHGHPDQHGSRPETHQSHPDAHQRHPGTHGTRHADRQVAYDNGFQHGLHEGQQDRRSNHRFRFEDERDFQRGDKGYHRDLGDKDQYRQTFREGFADGYAEGYGNHGGDTGAAGHDRRDDGDAHDSPFDIGARDGYEKGREDARAQDRYDPRHHTWYREGDHEYHNRHGSRAQYKNEYRRGFTSGYDQGFREGRHR